MERLNRTNQTRTGMVSIVTLFAILGFLLLIMFVGNMGSGVHYKIDTQNGADAAAISSGNWMARGLNSITATNHMLGEATAIVTIHEALGGPEVSVGIEATTEESQALDQLINLLVKVAPIRGLPVYGLTPDGSTGISRVDKDFLEFVADRIAADDGNHKAFATIYDSKITLKKELIKWLIAKSVANLGLFVPPPWGYGTAAAAFAAHLAATHEITGITKEWLILSALEEVVVRTKDVKTKILEERLIPALSRHADLIAALDQESSLTGSLSHFTGGLVGQSIQDSLEQLEKNAKLTTFPRAAAIVLPVEPEPSPSLRGGPNEPEWVGSSKDQSSAPAINQMKIVRDHYKRVGKVNKQIRQLESDVNTLDIQETDIEEMLNDPQLSPQSEQELKSEIREITKLETSKQKTIADLKEKLAAMQAEFRKLMDTLDQSQSTINRNGGNLSDEPDHLPAKLNQAEERTSQWVRATYPYVDALRAPILAQFENQLSRSNAKQHFIKWTNRYTLVKAWQFRSGYRFEKTGAFRGQWAKSKNVESLRMLVLKGAFDRNGREQKGRESWTKSDSKGKLAAEEMFTVLGLAHRDYQTLYAAQVFGKPHERGMTAYAQAIVYNANEQAPTTNVGNQSDNPPLNLQQPRAGWDTLNWDSTSGTPEWGSIPTVSDAKWPWDVFTSAPRLDSIKVKLNWQSKLMPATQTRIAAAAIDNATSDLGQTLSLSAIHFEGLSSH